MLVKILKNEFNAPPETAVIDFIKAVKSGNNTDVIKYINEYGIDAVSKLNSPVFYLAAIAGQNDTVVLLREKGADINSINDSGWSALLLAGANGYADGVRMLLEAGADIHTPDRYGTTVMCFADEPTLVGQTLRQWISDQQKLAEEKKQRFSAEQEQIAKTIMGGLTRNLPMPRRLKF